jgi:S1-C subfamily serine protease
MNKDESFCNKSLKIWIVLASALFIMLVVWIIFRGENIRGENVIVEREREATAATKAPLPLAGEPVFPQGIRNAAMPGAYANNNNARLAAITKATPGGGMQLVASTSPGVFQNSLKDAVNAILPSTCDIHARRFSQPNNAARAQDAQNLKFVPPFDGIIDKFIQNKGFENIGAGLIVDERGYVVTNYHVTMEAADIVVTVFGNPPKDYTARTIAQDQARDLAILKLSSDGPFSEAVLGDSSFCGVGDYVIAVGSPFGIEQTVTSGIISGVRKSVLIEGSRYESLFQTDAAINRGSSGGPLVNMSGEVIGLNTAIYAPTGVFSGTGFAIPINDVKDFLSANLGRGYPITLNKRGMAVNAIPKTNIPPDAPIPTRFGVEVIRVNATVASQFGVSSAGGVLVNRVIPESPASFAGIQRGDIITSIAGVPVNDMSDIPKIVSHFRSGDNVNVRIIRNTATDELMVSLR